MDPKDTVAMIARQRLFGHGVHIKSSSLIEQSWRRGSSKMVVQWLYFIFVMLLKFINLIYIIISEECVDSSAAMDRNE